MPEWKGLPRGGLESGVGKGDGGGGGVEGIGEGIKMAKSRK